MLWRRSESNRERVLLRLLEASARREQELLDRIMLLTGQPWNVPPADLREPRQQPDYVPPDWTATPEEAPLY